MQLLVIVKTIAKKLVDAIEDFKMSYLARVGSRVVLREGARSRYASNADYHLDVGGFIVTNALKSYEHVWLKRVIDDFELSLPKSELKLIRQ